MARSDDHITVVGSRWRVKMSISDYSDSPIETCRQIPISFWIQILPAHWPKSASFASYGAVQKKFSFHDMIAHAEGLSGQKIKIPKRWKKYAGLKHLQEAVQDMQFLDKVTRGKR